ncbi:MAG: type II toxin-antitoxin system RelE/ParE family toxin [Melioribacteraceae bacterium]|nr:type II toxin-antitoxin system RelE/ParE family toxin [Melioribacteraceae bacterium]
MEIYFKNKKTEKVFNSFRTLSQKHGDRQARKTIQRINELMAAETLNDINMLRAPGLHLLSGKLKGLWAVNLVHPFRLILEPLDGDTEDLRKTTKIKVIEIINYH